MRQRLLVRASIVLSVLSFLAADVWMLLGAGGPYGLIWFLIVCSGICMAIASLKRSYAGTALLLIAVAHASALGILAATDEHTFYGGAIVPLMACYCWAAIALGLLGITGKGWLRAHRQGNRTKT